MLPLTQLRDSSFALYLIIYKVAFMKKLVILGAGTAGTMMANHLHHKLDRNEWSIDIIDERTEHHYQPGYLFLPFDIYTPENIIKNIKDFIPKDLHLITHKIDKIIAKENTIQLTGGDKIPYDLLIIATGSKIAPEETEGMKGPLWHKDVFDFYTFEE